MGKTPSHSPPPSDARIFLLPEETVEDSAGECGWSVYGRS